MPADPSPQGKFRREPHRKKSEPAPTYKRLRAASQTDFQVDGGPYDDYLRRVREALGEEMALALDETERPGPMLDLLVAAHAVPYSVAVGKVDVPLSPEAVLFRRARKAGLVCVVESEETRRNVAADPLEEDRPVCTVTWGGA